LGERAQMVATIATAVDPHPLPHRLGELPDPDSRGNFVFFETGQPHEMIAAQLIRESIEIARAFPPFDQWIRISISLSAENARARDTIKKLLE
jgi:histidinol-phosphate aminotransferase